MVMVSPQSKWYPFKRERKSLEIFIYAEKHNEGKKKEVEKTICNVRENGPRQMQTL